MTKHVFRLDKSRVPPEMLDDPRLAEKEKAVRIGMQNETYRMGVCLHDAAHAIYIERSGGRVTFHPPVARYDLQIEDFVIGTAAVQADFGPVPIEVELEAMAHWLVAGDVARRLLTGDSSVLFDDGYERDLSEFFEDSDKSDFESFSSNVAAFGLNSEQISENWEQAKRDVEKDLRSPAFKGQIWERAWEFEHQLLEMMSVNESSLGTKIENSNGQGDRSNSY
jgi:hypothetical protein